MSVRFESVTWTDLRPPAELVAQAKAGNASYLLIEPVSGWTALDVIDDASRKDTGPNVIVVFDPLGPADWQRQESALPSLLKLMAFLPDCDSSVAVSIKSLETKHDVAERCGSLCEFVLRLAETESVAFHGNNRKWQPQQLLPTLTIPANGSRTPWLCEMIQRVKVTGASSTQLAALHAGMYLLNDFFEESHSSSQSIEGMAPHTGDYWHAILHRREPDYGNSKYWFRHVGRHAAFDEVLRRVKGIMHSDDDIPARLVARGDWDAFAFVDLCEKAERDEKLKDCCEQIQFQEMLALLEATYREIKH